MPGNRSVRHVKVPVDGYRRDWREKVIYAADMVQGSGATAATIGVSPVWQVDNAAHHYVFCDLKLPIDYILGSPLRFRIVFCTAGGGGSILFYVRYLVASLGTDLTGVTTPLFVIPVASAANIQNVTDTMILQSTELDGLVGPVNLQLQIGREGAHALDTNAQNAYIIKVIVEYLAYE